MLGPNKLGPNRRAIHLWAHVLSQLPPQSNTCKRGDALAAHSRRKRAARTKCVATAKSNHCKGTAVDGAHGQTRYSGTGLQLCASVGTVETTVTYRTVWSNEYESRAHLPLSSFVCATLKIEDTISLVLLSVHLLTTIHTGRGPRRLFSLRISRSGFSGTGCPPHRHGCL